MVRKQNRKNQSIPLPDPLDIFRGAGGGIESWLGANTPNEVKRRLGNIENEPLSFEYLNQLLILSHEAGLSRGFFKYYWLSDPHTDGVHPYNVSSIRNFSKEFLNATHIVSPEHLAWGLERLYVDALLFFGNVREGYRQLRNKTLDELRNFFLLKCFDTTALLNRGESIPLASIPRDDRYLIAEVACKTYDESVFSNLRQFLASKLDELKPERGKRVTARSLLGSNTIPKKGDVQLKFDLFNAEFSLDEILDEEIEHGDALQTSLSRLARKFEDAREKALHNTDLYLSLAYDLDAYVATSMRSRDDFRQMADRCSQIFDHPSLRRYKIRYFDPTMSAARSHEDKGLIECLMVKCAKILVYMAGQKESYGKDAEAAMALSMGKHVIFLCDPDTRTTFYRDVHPLSRLINFETGVAVGSIVTDKVDDVQTLIHRIFSNSMEYRLERKRDNYLILKEGLTNSVVRVQTDDKLLAETFWNYYHSNPFNDRQT